MRYTDVSKEPTSTSDEYSNCAIDEGVGMVPYAVNAVTAHQSARMYS